MTYRFVARDRCPACANPGAETLWQCRFDEGAAGHAIREHYRVDPSVLDGIYRLDECSACGLIFQRYIADGPSMADLYATFAHEEEVATDSATYRADMADVPGSRDAHELMTLARFLGKPRLKVLDYGTGWGLWPAIASRLGHDAYATELAPDKSAWAARSGAHVIRDDEIAGHRFDVINLEQVLEHVPDPLALLRTLVPQLDGVLKLSLPNAAGAKATVAAMASGAVPYDRIMPIFPLEHINSFDRRALAALAVRLGLREVRPTYRQRYAFLRGGIPRGPKRILKEFARPFWTFSNPRNLYTWFVPADHAATAFTAAKLSTRASDSEPPLRFSTQILNDPAATPLTQYR